MGERILVTGATGFIGLHVARRLADAGREPRLLFRRPERAALVAPLDAELVSGDLAAPETLDRAVEGVDVVLHLAGRATFERLDRLRPTLVDGTCALAEAAARAGVRSFVFASSTFVHASPDAPIDATTPPAPVIDYGRAKVLAEQGLRAIGERTGMRVANLRLAHVYGPGSLLFEQIRRRRVVFPGHLDRCFSHVHVDDAARALIAAGDVGHDGALPVADRQPTTWATFFEVVRTYQPDVRFLRIPPAPVIAALRLAEPIIRVVRRPTMLSPDTVRGWTFEQRVDSTATWDALDMDPTHASAATGIPASLDAAFPYRYRHPLDDHRR